ncbi:MAG: lactate utilization protein [Oscillospiraceae bacterium]|nr:lactate utilization protein [Oscillospiraceae bacterium]
MNPVKQWRNETLAKKMVDFLPTCGYTAYYAQNADEAKAKILELIPKGSSIAMGGSVTLGDMEIVDIFRGDDYKFFERFNVKSYDEQYNVYRQSFLADYLVTSTNALTKNGELMNVDSSGNRVAGMILGPENVIIVCGVNKIVDNLDEGFKRLRKVGPMNCRRVGHQTPCFETAECEDCQIQARMCNYTGIIHNGRKHEGRYTIIVVAEELGF